MDHCTAIKIMFSNNIFEMGPYNKTLLRKKHTKFICAYRKEKKTHN